MKIKHDIDGKLEVDRSLAMKFPEELALKYNILILGLRGEALVIAMAEYNPIHVDIVKMYFNYRLEVISLDGELIREEIRKLYFLKDSRNLFSDSQEVKDSYIVNLVNNIINKAVELNSTDIHFEPYEDEIRVRYRINGDLKYIYSIDIKDYDSLISRLKIISNLDISEKRLPQEGRVMLNFDRTQLDIRVSVIPSFFGEKVVFRLLNKSNFDFKLESLGVSDGDLEKLMRLIGQPYGMILVTGPAGSGKTTTLYTFLKELNSIKKNIITIEDPVEYSISGINQSQVNLKIGYDFERAFKAILRQDPDLIMIGEIRDSKLAKLSLRAAVTGHLILSTLHTYNSLATIYRLVSMGVEDYLISSAILGIISQRLVKILCPDCKQARRASQTESEILNLDYRPLIYQEGGCSNCVDGFIYRKPIMEILIMDREIRDLIQTSKDINVFEEFIRVKDIETLGHKARELVLAGQITFEEFMEVNLTI